MIHFVNIGGIEFSNECSDSIVTHGLASCVALTAYSKSKKIAGMIHVALPEASQNGINHKVGYFAEKGIPIFLETLKRDYGCTLSELELKIFGGSNSINGNDVFNIGAKNIKAVRTILDTYSLKYNFEETGDLVSRTIELSVKDGCIKVSKLPIKI